MEMRHKIETNLLKNYQINSQKCNVPYFKNQRFEKLLNVLTKL